MISRKVNDPNSTSDSACFSEFVGVCLVFIAPVIAEIRFFSYFLACRSSRRRKEQEIVCLERFGAYFGRLNRLRAFKEDCWGMKGINLRFWSIGDEKLRLVVYIFSFFLSFLRDVVRLMKKGRKDLFSIFNENWSECHVNIFSSQWLLLYTIVLCGFA